MRFSVYEAGKRLRPERGGGAQCAEKWSLPGHGPGYASPVLARFAGVEQLVTMTDKAVVGVGVSDGKQLWTIPFPDEWNENIVTPIVVGDLVIVSGTRKGTFGYRVAKAGHGLAATQVWHNTDLMVLRRNPEKFEELRRYKVADSQTWAQPVVLKDSLIVRSADAVTKWGLR